ncbi:MAG: transporter substrate-binding protein [Herminiimonas sp.]|nr:transporter substrate-binding protein [Herminiimonas sp.]
MMMKRLLKLKCWLPACMFLLAAPIHAQVPMYEGADRMQRLLDGAHREGVLSVYTSMAEKDISRLVSAFEKKYGIKVKVWRAGTDKVLQRVISEAHAGHSEVDFVLSTAPEMEALYREKLLQPVHSPMQKDLIPAALPAHREWTGMRVYVYVQAYNTQKIKRDELPRTYQDLLNPRWKGRLAVESKHEWFYTLVQAMGEEKGLRFFREVVAVNGMSLRSGSTLLANMVSAGEVPLALNLYKHVIEPLRAKSAPIDYISLSPTIASTDAIAIMRRSPHPYAATLFYDFALSDGQKIVADNSISTNRRDEAILARFQPIIFSDPVKILDSYDKWDKLFDDTANGR